MQTVRETILHLSLIKGVGPASVDALIRKESESHILTDIYDFSAADLMNYVGLSEKTAYLIADGLRDTTMLEKELQLIASSGVTVLTMLDEQYPALLAQVHLPPPIVYVQGSIDACHQQAIALVGSRAANAYGKRVVQMLVPPLVAHDFAIISGGAQGIDTYAHQAAINAGGATVVVLGSGLLKPYPASNKKLFDAVVAAGGCIISSFPLAMEALPGHFPARNRIISGLAKGSIVVQAAAKSGALITAQYALNQGREVFAVPGAIDDPLAAGCHELIRQGATLISSAHDILEHFGYVLSPEKAVDTKKSAKQLSIAGALKTDVTKPVAGDTTPGGSILAHCVQPTSF